MARISPLLIAPPAIFAALTGLFLSGMFRDNPGQLPSTFIGQSAPTLPTEPVIGLPLLTQEDLASGDITIVNFWASWCPPCRAEHPYLLELEAEGYRVAGINFRDLQDQASAYLTDDGNPFFATGFDPRGRSAIDWGVAAPPETFIVGRDGTILHRHVGPLVGSVVEQQFLPALDAAMAD
jgi:cytochrome c biogenesis protein CcmG/thiol:disulfide interchange protein DsbE